MFFSNSFDFLEFLLGEDVLVAPILEEGAETRNVYLPNIGSSYVWQDGNNATIALPGGQSVSYTAPLGTVPFFLRQAAPTVP